MGALQLKATMAAIALALEEAKVVDKAWPHPTSGSASPGEAVVWYPPDIAFDMTFGRGADTVTFPVYILVGIAGEDETLDALDRLLGDGSQSVKTALEDGTLGGLSDVISDLHVSTGGVDVLEFDGGVKYAALRFDAEVIT